MIALSEKAIKEYQDLYQKEYGEEISFAEASNQAQKLINLMKIIYKPISIKKAKND